MAVFAPAGQSADGIVRSLDRRSMVYSIVGGNGPGGWSADRVLLATEANGGFGIVIESAGSWRL